MVGIIYPNVIVTVSSSVLSVNKTKVLMYVDNNMCIHHIAFWIQNANVLDKQGICRK